MMNQKGDFGVETPQKFAERNALPIKDILLLNRALTHRSFLNENPEALEDNERLEFLGDAVLDYIVGAWLYHHFPEMAEGDRPGTSFGPWGRRKWWPQPKGDAVWCLRGTDWGTLPGCRDGSSRCVCFSILEYSRG